MVEQLENTALNDVKLTNFYQCFAFFNEGEHSTKEVGELLVEKGLAKYTASGEEELKYLKETILNKIVSRYESITKDELEDHAESDSESELEAWLGESEGEISKVLETFNIDLNGLMAMARKDFKANMDLTKKD